MAHSSRNSTQRQAQPVVRKGLDQAGFARQWMEMEARVEARRERTAAEARRREAKKPTGRAGMTFEERKAAHNKALAEWKKKHGNALPKVH